ncbi:hypothetical protein [Mucilaginibacter gilvus]|uniref:Uncharacterized protein n=1 Tax=Mucilaginibacter gilvus TaxID=2305909 RepID=A0A3S3W3G0_9SPHI|nr:hypothetical protein [Mucilaginibacter gilvus]RWY47476.1 hypothetical protein EPL05_21775 [Mucilaginibacter gilvus]
MTKGLLLIDDSQDHTGVLTNISDHLRANEHINITTRYINPIAKPYWDDNKDPNVDNVLAAIRTEFLTLSPGLIIVDQYYSDTTSFDGIYLISKLREIPKFKTCPIFLISGKRDKIVRDIFTNGDKTETDKVNELSKIIGYGISRFLDKSFKDEAIEILKHRNLNDIFPAKLREYELQEIKIKKFSPKFSEFSLQQLADHIDSNSSDASSILEEMFELTLAHYAKIDAGL